MNVIQSLTVVITVGLMLVMAVILLIDLMQLRNIGPDSIIRLGRHFFDKYSSALLFYEPPLIGLLLSQLVIYLYPEVFGMYDYYTHKQITESVYFYLLALFCIPGLVLFTLWGRFNVTPKTKQLSIDIRHDHQSKRFEKALDRTYGTPSFNGIIQRAFENFEGRKVSRFDAYVYHDYLRSKDSLLNRTDDVGTAFRERLEQWNREHHTP